MDNFSMENKSDENEKPRETVTLVLKAKRFEVEKQKLIDKSQYFAALLSANYLEYHRTEHIINYDISPILLQNFIGWIHNDELDTSATSFNFKDFDRLLYMLELSVLFVADNLLKDVTNRLETHYMLPKYSLSIWLLAQELNINLLRDLSFAVCLDAFNELPSRSICKLSRENFLKLIGNINIRSKESYLLRITHRWMNYHHDFTVSLDIIKNKKAKIVNSIISCEGLDIINSKNYIQCWDGKDFFELTSFNYPKDITDCSTGKNTLVGMQIVGRTYDLYLCGGEFGVGSGKFNKNVWRYSLISKKWYLQTVMPVERKDMVAAFLNNKLLLVGGMGKDGQKLQSVDVYNIYTGIWTSGANTPWNFDNLPKHCIFDGNLILYTDTTDTCIYYSDKDVWQRNELPVRILPWNTVKRTQMLPLEAVSCYIDIYKTGEMVLRDVTETCNIKDCTNRIMHYSFLPIKYEKTKTIYFVTYFHIVKIHNALNPDVPLNIQTAITLVTDKSGIKFNEKLHMHNLFIKNELHPYKRNKPDKFHFLRHLPERFFRLHHPAFLYTTNLDFI